VNEIFFCCRNSPSIISGSIIILKNFIRAFNKVGNPWKSIELNLENSCDLGYNTVVMVTTINFAPGDIVKVHQKIQEGEKTRIQVFKGVVLGIRGRGGNKMFTVQKKVGTIAVERIWPVASPMIERIEIDEKPRRRIRRAKLNFLKVPKQ